MLDDGLILGVHRDSLEGHVVELDQIIKLHELLEAVVRLPRVLLFKVLIPHHNRTLDLISDVIKTRTNQLEKTHLHAMLDLGR